MLLIKLFRIGPVTGPRLAVLDRGRRPRTNTADRSNPIWNFETREAGLLMDVDKDILLAQCLRNSVRLVYRFEIDCVRQYRGQKSWSAKLLIS